MKLSLKRMICHFMVFAMAMLPFQSSQAGMIGVDQLVSSSAASLADRATVSGFLERAETSSQLQSMGVDAATAKARVAAMTDAEVGTLAGKINAQPAGADGGSLLLLIVVIFAIWYFAFRR